MTHLKPAVKEDMKVLDISSEVFATHTYIPQRYTCDGENINPPLSIGNIPKEAKSLVLVMEDPDAPIRTWVHWLMWDIPPIKKIKEKSIPGTEGINDFRQHHYGGPCPPSGTHHYHFKIYALDDLLHLNTSTTLHELEKAMSPHILAFGETIALYKKLNN
jgi:hypothetical protein